MDTYSFGQFLREAREARGIELAEAVAALRIRQPILEAFEAGEFVVANLSDIQVRGMLRNYAGLLQLDEEDVLRRYREARFGKRSRGRWRLRRKTRSSPRRAQRPGAAAPMQEIDVEQFRAARRRTWISLALIFAFSAVAIALIAFVTNELIEAPMVDENETTLIAADASPETASTATRRPPPTVTPTAISPTPSNRALYSGSGVLASIMTTQRTWIRIVGDGVERYADIAAPGALLEYEANSEILITAANAMALDVVWNGQPQGQIGGRGQRVDMRFAVDEIAINLGAPGAPTPISPTAPVTATTTPTSAAIIVTATPPVEVVEAASPLPAETTAEAAVLSDTPLPSATATATATPTVTDTATASVTPTVSAILPPRVTQVGLPPTKEGA